MHQSFAIQVKLIILIYYIKLDPNIHENITCFSGTHLLSFGAAIFCQFYLFIETISVIASIIFIPSSIIIEICFIETNPFSKAPFA